MKYFILSLFMVSNINAEESTSSKKNQFRYILSIGTTGLERNGNVVELERGPVFGISYERKFENEVSIGVQTHTNGQTGVTVGIDF